MEVLQYYHNDSGFRLKRIIVLKKVILWLILFKYKAKHCKRYVSLKSTEDFLLYLQELILSLNDIDQFKNIENILLLNQKDLITNLF